MADRDQLIQAFYDAIDEAVKDERTTPSELKDLAEAFSWIRSPNNSHGGGVKLDSR